MLQYFKQFFVKVSPEQEQQQKPFFQAMTEKLNTLKNQIDEINNEVILQNYLIELKNQINRDFKELKNYVDEAKIYIIFMGTTSAGKSTFINSLLGQQLLPSRNQECTKSIIMINYSDRIAINNKAIHNLVHAQQILLEMQREEQFQIINLEVPSVFLEQFPVDLRNRIIFVDTPGIKLSQYQMQKEHFQIIDEKINQHHRINIWISNYTTFDSDIELQKQILKLYSQSLSTITISKEMSDIRQYIDESSFIKTNSTFVESQQEIQLAPLFFILNKYDQKRKSEDSNIESTLQQISNIIGNDNYIFKISSIRALGYQIMNYGNKQSVDKFIESFFIDNKDIYLFQTQSDCRKHCQNQIKTNHNLIQSQDFQKFQNQLICQIKLQLSKGFYNYQLKNIGQSLAIFNLNQRVIQLSQENYDQLLDFLQNFIDLQIKNYDDLIGRLTNETILQIEAVVKKCQNELTNENDKSKPLKKICQNTIEIFVSFEEKVNELNKMNKSVILTKLKKLFPSKNKQLLFQSTEIIGYKENTIIEGCEKLYELLSDSQMSTIQKQAFDQYAQSILKTIGVKVNYYSKGIGITANVVSVVCYFGKKYLTPVFAAIGVGVMAFDLDFLFGSKWYSSSIVEEQLLMWKSSLISQIKELRINYSQINAQTLNSIRQLIKNLMNQD